MHYSTTRVASAFANDVNAVVAMEDSRSAAASGSDVGETSGASLATSSISLSTGATSGVSAGSGRAAAKSIKIKDPSAKGNVVYDVPLPMVHQTQGYVEHHACLMGRSDKRPSHRACLCKLFLEGRCAQHENCKSFHVNPDYIERCRREQKVVLDDNFLNEVVVRMQNGTLFAVRFPAVLSTKGLDEYKKAARRGNIKPAVLCPSSNPQLGKGGTCSADKHCPYIHVRHSELKDLSECRLRTPCCQEHGDEMVTPTAAVQAELCIGTSTWTLPLSKTAVTARRLVCGILSATDICIPHVKGRCKYGRCCDRFHICRAWAKQAKVLEPLILAAEKASGSSGSDGALEDMSEQVSSSSLRAPGTSPVSPLLVPQQHPAGAQQVLLVQQPQYVMQMQVPQVTAVHPQRFQQQYILAPAYGASQAMPQPPQQVAYPHTHVPQMAAAMQSMQGHPQVVYSVMQMAPQQVVLQQGARAQQPSDDMPQLMEDQED